MPVTLAYDDAAPGATLYVFRPEAGAA